MVTEQFLKKYGATIIGLAVIAIWAIAILAIMISIFNKSIPNM